MCRINVAERKLGVFTRRKKLIMAVNVYAQTGPKGVIMDYHRHMKDKEFRDAEKKRDQSRAIEQSAPTVKTWVSNLSQRSN